MFLKLYGLLSVVALMPPLAAFPVQSGPGGVNKASFEKIKIGMTRQEVEKTIGCERVSTCGTFAGCQVFMADFWQDNDKFIFVSYDCLAGITVSGASFEDKSSPTLSLYLPPVPQMKLSASEQAKQVPK